MSNALLNTFQGTAKKRRSVAFKKQNYHSVYEYPKEAVSLSPAYSAPHMTWDRIFSPGALAKTSAAGAAADLAGLDGFTVTSSARPFHGAGVSCGSQFNAQCHTWPTTDSDFSWSQVQVSVCPCNLANLKCLIVLGGQRENG